MASAGCTARSPEDLLYYIALYNENYVMPARPDGLTDAEIVRGLYRFRVAPELTRGAPRTTILSGGSIMLQALEAQTVLAERYGVAADVWSATSYQLLRNEALDVDRWNLLHPGETPRVPVVSQLLGEAGGRGPIVAVSDWIRAWPDMISRWIPGDAWCSLGTDGFGRSDSRTALRRFFGVDTAHIVAAALSELARCGQVPVKVAQRAMGELGRRSRGSVLADPLTASTSDIGRTPVPWPGAQDHHSRGRRAAGRQRLHVHRAGRSIQPSRLAHPGTDGLDTHTVPARGLDSALVTAPPVATASDHGSDSDGRARDAHAVEVAGHRFRQQDGLQAGQGQAQARAGRRPG